MIYIRSLLFNAVFYLWTGFWTILTLFALPLPLRYAYYPHDVWSRGLQRLVAIAGISVEFRGLENLPKEPALFACKHQSTWETTAFFSILPNAAIVVKKELGYIPVFGWYLLKMRELLVDRSAGASAIKKLVKSGRRAITDGRPIVIFPEGTRTAVGGKGQYQPGAYALYSMLGVQAVPVALNSGLFWPRRKFLKYPGKIVLEVLPPIPTGLDKKAFLRRLEKDIETASARLVREGRKDKKS